jgi:hypothetical protein
MPEVLAPINQPQKAIIPNITMIHAYALQLARIDRLIWGRSSCIFMPRDSIRYSRVLESLAYG